LRLSELDGNTLLFGPTHAEPGRYRRRFGRNIFDMKIGNVIGHVGGGIDGVRCRCPSGSAGGSQRARIAEPVTRYFQRRSCVDNGRGNGVAIVPDEVDVGARLSSSRVHTTFTGPSTCLAMRTADTPCRARLAAETAAEQVLLTIDFVDREAAAFAPPTAPDSRSACRSRFRGIGREVNRGIQRLHAAWARGGSSNAASSFFPDARPCRYRGDLGPARPSRWPRANPQMFLSSTGRSGFIQLPQRIEAFLAAHVIPRPQRLYRPHHNLLHARDSSWGAVIDLTDLAANTGRPGRRELHAGKHCVDAIDGLCR